MNAEAPGTIAGAAPPRSATAARGRAGAGTPLEGAGRPAPPRVRLSVLLLALLVPALVLAGCRRSPPAARPQGGESAPVEPASLESAEAEAVRLRESGPTLTEYDRSPRILWTDETQRLLTDELLPVLEAQGLPTGTAARYWVLIGADGHVWDVVLQATSGNEAFDQAAARVAGSLRFTPAGLAGEPVGAWVLRKVSLLMQ